MSNGLQLPACQKCKLRKVRCDRKSPKCTNCNKGGVACIIVDAETGKQYSRAYIAQLEREEISLTETLAGLRPARVASTAPPASNVTHNDAQRSNHYVGDGSGLGFLNSILSDTKWQQLRTHILSQLAARPGLDRQHPTPNALPPPLEAQQLLNNYFTRFHIHHTFLLRGEVLAIYDRVYSASRNENELATQDRFRLLMVFAISSTTRHRAGLSSESPYGYFMAAESYLRDVPLIGSIEAIENLLLIARFGMYHHIGISMWDISQMCMRQCIEWRLHVRTSSTANLVAEQHHRRVFWECYVLDRHNSGMLGRPFAIAESEISVPLPVDVDDEVLAASTAATLDLVPPDTSSNPTELSVFIHCIRLRQISCRIHTKFYTGRKTEPRFDSTGHVCASFSRFRTELSLWRDTMPFFPSPRSLYERPEWHDFLYEKDLMLLARGAMHNLTPRSATSAAMKMILMPCYDSASRVIQLYADLMDKQAITWTRHYFLVIFTAGLTVIYCVSLEVDTNSQSDRDPLRTLEMCHNVLNFFKEKMPDGGPFAVVFSLLKEECVRHRLRTSVPQNLGTIDNSASVAFGSIDTSATMENGSFNALDNAHVFDSASFDLGFGLTDSLDLMAQLESEVGEYAWGWIPMDDSVFKQGLY